MELKEISTYQFKQNAIKSFNLVSSRLHVGLLGSTYEAVVLEMNHSSANYTFPYTVDTVKLPSDRATSEVVNKLDLAAIYSKACVLRRQYIALDPVYVSELSEEPIKFQAVSISWAPKNFFGESTLAIVSNNGTCELRRKDVINREWNIVVYSLNELYYKEFPIPNPESIKTFESLKETVENYFTTSFSWNMDSSDLSHTFVTSNATGWILLFNVNNKKVNCCGCYKTSLGRISYIYFIKNLIFVCSAEGIMKMYTLNGTTLEESETLWYKKDRIACQQVHMSFSEEHDKWILVTSKGSHILAFVLSKKGIVHVRSASYLGNIEITGFDILAPCEYIFATITGSVRWIGLTITGEQLHISSQQVKTEFDNKNYQILGLVASPNKVAWTFLLYHNKTYTHPSMYSSKDAIISVCSLNTNDAFTILQNKLIIGSNLLDCAAVVQLEIIKEKKDILSSNYENIDIDEPQITEFFLRKLQLKLFILNAVLIYQRLKYKHEKKTITSEINSLSKLVECVFLNLRLQFLQSLRNHTPFQLLSGRCMKNKLKQLQSHLIPNEDIFRNIQENINTLSDCLLQDLGPLFDTAEENCSYCQSPIDFTSLMCSNLHAVPRCSISYVQVSLFSRLFCNCCSSSYFCDNQLLKSLFPEGEEIKCTFCGFLLPIKIF